MNAAADIMLIELRCRATTIKIILALSESRRAETRAGLVVASCALAARFGDYRWIERFAAAKAGGRGTPGGYDDIFLL